MFRYFLYIVSFSLLFHSCNDQSDRPKIGLLMDSFVHQRWDTDKKSIEAELDDLGAEVIFRVAEGNAKLQLEQAIELIGSGISVLIVVAVDQDFAAQIVQYANTTNVKVIAYDRLIKKCDLDYYISFDNVNIGMQQAKSIVDNVNKPEICVIGGALNDNNSFMIFAGQNAVLQPLQTKGDIRIRASLFTEHWFENEGYSLAYNVLKNHPEINAVLAANDAIATGVVRAANELGVKDVYITGMDADSVALTRIKLGTQAMTIYKPIIDLATTTAKLAYNLSIGDTLAVQKNKFVAIDNGQNLIKSILLPSIVVDSFNVDLMLDK